MLLSAILLTIGVVALFLATGGMGLLRIIQPYLLRDLPDKRYGWSDFVPSNSTNKISGFYSPQLSGGNGVGIWTLAGLQRFYHQPQFSVYYHRDVCGAVKSIQDDIAEIGDKAAKSRLGANLEDRFFDIDKWKKEMKSEYFVTIQWAEKDGKKVVDKLWSVSGRYKLLGLIGEDTCDY